MWQNDKEEKTNRRIKEETEEERKHEIRTEWKVIRKTSGLENKEEWSKPEEWKKGNRSKNKRMKGSNGAEREMRERLGGKGGGMRCLEEWKEGKARVRRKSYPPKKSPKKGRRESM